MPIKNGADLYIDLGTANTLVVSKTKGIIANEPSVIAYQESPSGLRKVVAVGNEAKSKIGRSPGNLVASFPLRAGVIADMDTTEAMLKYFMQKAGKKTFFRKPQVVISLPFGVSDIEKKAVINAGRAAGAREVYLIEEPMAAAIGSGLPIGQPKGNMVIDIGGGTTEIAVISLYGVVHCEAVRIGGHVLDESIVEYMRKKHNLIIGDQTAERVKMEVGSALPGGEDTATVRGLDFVSGLPRRIEISSHDIYLAMKPHLDHIIEAAKKTLEKTPPDLLADIIQNGVQVAGGGALIRGITERLAKELQVPALIAEEPLLSVAKGGERVIQQPEILERIMIGLH